MLKKIFIAFYTILFLSSPAYADTRALFAAVKNNNTEALAQALAASSIESRDANNYSATPLIAAAKINAIDSVRYLITQNADIDAIDKRGRTALIWASMNNYVEVMQLLIDAGVNINYETKNFANALRVARAFKKQEAIDLLVANGAEE